jgi:hypothetical protein
VPPPDAAVPYFGLVRKTKCGGTWFHGRVQESGHRRARAAGRRPGARLPARALDRLGEGSAGKGSAAPELSDQLRMTGRVSMHRRVAGSWLSAPAARSRG